MPNCGGPAEAICAVPPARIFPIESTDRLKTTDGSPQKLVAAIPPDPPNVESSSPDEVNRTTLKLFDAEPSPPAKMYCCEFTDCSVRAFRRYRELMLAWPFDPKVLSRVPLVLNRK